MFHTGGMRFRQTLFVAFFVAAAARVLPAQHLLIPMDDRQTNHLKAYGLIFNALRDGHKSEWFLNYRGVRSFWPTSRN